MRLAILCLSALLFASLTSAQVTITQNEMPAAGDELFRTQAVLNPFLNYNNTGPNTTWNFNNLVADGQSSRSYQTVGSTNIVYSLVYADIFFNSNRANHVTDGVDIPFYELLPIEDPFTFYFRSSTAYRKVGYGAEVAGIPLPITMDQQDVIYQLPLSFGNTSTSNSSYSIDVPTLAFYGYRQQRVNVVDGWGTVNTPAGSFNALRVKTTIAGRDTIQVDQFSLGFEIERPLITEYKWLSPGRRVPVLQINTATLFGTEVITEIFFFDEERTLTVAAPLANNFCPGNTVQLNYTRTGVFNQGGFLVAANVFRAQLSDATGSFDNPVNIGSVTSTQSGSINATIPANTPPGTGYRIRVIATNPSFVGTSNAFNITIGTTPQALASAAGPAEFCAGASVLLNAATAPANSYQWQLNGADIAGATSASLEVQASGSYRVVVSTSCGTAASAPVAVLVNALPEHALVAPGGLSTCAGVPVSFSGSDLSGQSDLAYQWLLDGQAIGSATSSELIASVAGAYSLRITNTATGCSFTTNAEVLEVETVPVPTALALNATTVCDGATVQLEASGADGATYQWFLDGEAIVGADATEFGATTSGSYTVSATSASGCTSDVSVSIPVTVDPVPSAPTVNALGATTFCDGGEVELVANGDANVAWQWFLDGSAVAGAETDELTVDAAGTYTAVATNAFGCSTEAGAPVTVVVDPVPAAPSVLAAGVTTVCDGESVLLEASDAGGATYQWSLNGVAIAAADASTLAATTSGTYTVDVTNSFGCTSSTSNGIAVTVDPVPTIPSITASGATTFCAGDEVSLLANGDADVAWQWFLDGSPVAGADTDELNVGASGTYTAIATNAFGCSTEAGAPVTVVVDSVPAAPTVQAAGVTTVCDGESVLLEASDADGSAYQWSLDGVAITAADASTLAATTSGTYTVDVTNSFGCTSSVSNGIAVTVDPVPTIPSITASGATTFCAGGEVSLVANGNADVVWQWYLDGTPIQGSNDPELTVAVSGAYGVMATNSFGCAVEAVALVEVVVNPTPPVPAVVAADAVLFCEGGAVTLIASGANGATYQWTLDGAPIAGANFNQYLAMLGGAYGAVTISAQGCTSSSSNTVVVTVNGLPSAPVATATGPTDICAGATVGLVATGDPGSAFEWYLNSSAILGAGGSGYSAEATGSYTAIATDANGCASLPSNAVVVEVEPLPAVPTLTALDATTFCAGGAVVIVATSDAGAVFQWYFDEASIPGANAAQFVANASGSYSAMAISATGCSSVASTPTLVTVNTLPVEPGLTASGPTAFCEGGNVELLATADAGVQFQWSVDGDDIAGADTAEFTATISGAYAVTVTDANGCSATSGIATVFANPIPASVGITASGSTTICAGSTVDLQAGIAPGIGYQWYLDGVLLPGVTSQTYAASMAGVHTVVAVSAEGCAADASNSIEVTVNPGP
ncbi:MAG: hypothetical protein WEC15_04535, partial [Flavobacteriales bacterium]